MTVGELREAIEPELRPTDVAVAVEERGLAVLFPLEAGRDAEAAAQSYLEVLRGAGNQASVKLWTMDEAMSPEHLWEEIVRAVG